MSAPGRPKRESLSAQREGSPMSAPGRPKRESLSAQREGSPVSGPRIVLIHATALAMEPIRVAFAKAWPEVELANVLDDSLSADRARSADLTPAMYQRFDALASYAVSIGAQAILFTCSAFGTVIDSVASRHSIPVLKPNQAMFDAAFAHGRRIGMVGTFAPAMTSMRDEFDEAARQGHPDATLQVVLAQGAREALSAGDAARHHALVAEAAAALQDVDAIMLAHFSTAPALAQAAERVAVPVLAAPDAAVARLRKLLGAR
jgi:Asp/Glu/hydantoin racemase